MVKHTQIIRRLLSANCLSVFDHFVELAFKGLNINYRPCSIKETEESLHINCRYSQAQNIFLIKVKMAFTKAAVCACDRV